MQSRLVPIVLMLIVAAASGGLLWHWSGNSDRMPEGGAAEPGGSASATHEFEALDEATQEYIWELEHVTFEIEQRLGPHFREALRTGNRSSLRAFLVDGFQATVPGDEADVVEHGSIRHESWRADGSPLHEVDADEFVEYQCRRLQAFDSLDHVGFRVLNIEAQDRDPTTGSWTLRVLLTATGKSAMGHRLSLEQTSTVDCRFDDDEDIIAGCIFASWSVEAESSTGGPALMEEATRQAGLDRLALHDNWQTGVGRARQYSMQIACDDWTLDGRPDIAIATLTGRAILLSPDEAGRFEDVTTRCDVPISFSVDEKQSLAALFDFDNDGDPDLLLGSGLYRNNEGRRFEAVENTGLRFGYNPMGCIVADYDCDGLLDFYVVYQSSRETNATAKPGWVGDDHSGATNELWRNVGGGRFQNVTESAGVAGERRHSFAATWLHANDDHFPDLYVANDFAQNEFYLNRGDGTFEDVSASSQTADFATSMGVAAGDIDGNGQPEIYVANMYSKMGRRIIAQVSESDYPPGVYDQLKGSCAGNRLYTPKAGGGSYTEISDQLGVNAVGWAYAPALADFDLDGLLDIYATAGFLSFRRDKPDG